MLLEARCPWLGGSFESRLQNLDLLLGLVQIVHVSCTQLLV